MPSARLIEFVGPIPLIPGRLARTIFLHPFFRLESRFLCRTVRRVPMSNTSQSPKAHEAMTPDEREAEHVRLLQEAVNEVRWGILKRKNEAGLQQDLSSGQGQVSTT